MPVVDSMTYQPMPLADFRLGRVANRKPWLLPPNSFQQLVNMRVRNGRVSRRAAVAFFGYLGQKRTQVGWKTGNGGSSYSGALSGFPVVPWAASPSTYAITVTAGAQSASVTSNNSTVTTGTLTGSGGTTGTLTYATGVLSVTFGSAVSGGTSIDVVYEFEARRPVMYVGSYIQSDGVEVLIAMDTMRMWLYKSSESRFYEVGNDTNKWVLDDDDYFDVETCNDGTRDIVVLTNGKEAPQKFYVSGGVGNLSAMATNFDGAPGNDITSAAFARINKSRLVYLAPNEGGTLHAGRARYTAAATVETMVAADYADMERVDFMTGLAVLRDEIYPMFNNSIFKLRYTRDFRAPFEWIEVTRSRGARSRKGCVEFDDRFYFPTSGGIHVSNGEQFDSITSEQMPDYVDEVNQDAASYMYGVRVDSAQEIWWVYATPEATTPNQLLVYNHETQAFSFWKFGGFAPHVIGSYNRLAAADTWDTKSGTWNTAAGTWDDVRLQSGFPVQLIGSYTGRVYLYDDDESRQKDQNSVATSDTAAINIVVKTPRLNPFVSGGAYRKIRMGMLQLMFEGLVDVKSFTTVRIYTDQVTSSGAQLAKTVSVTLVPEALTSDAAAKLIDVNLVGNWFEIEISHTGPARMVIDAIVPWFKDAAPARHIGSEL